MTDKLKSAVKFILFLGLGLGLLTLAFYNLDLDYDKVVAGFRNANYGWIGAALIASIASHLLRALRWNLMLEPLGKRPSAMHAFNAVMIGYLFNFAIPRMGEVSRCGILNRTDKIAINESLGTVVVERIFDMIILLLLTGVVLLAQFDILFGFFNETFLLPVTGKLGGNTGLLGAVLLLVMLAAAFLVYRNLDKLAQHKWIRKVINLFNGFASGFATVFRLKSPGLFFFYTIAIWFLYFVNTWCYLMAFAETADVSVAAGLSILVVGTFGFAAPVSGGIGAYHIFVAKGLALYGVGSVAGGVFGFVSHGMQMMMILAIGSASMIYTLIKERKAIAS